MKRRNRRRAFSLIELVVVIAVIGILISLLLPAVQQARESARKTACMSNLRQIGLAFQNYHDQFTLFPPFAVWANVPGEPLGDGQLPIGIVDYVGKGVAPASEPDPLHANWAVFLLPQIEQGNLWNKYNSNLPISAPENEEVRTAEISVMKCPSDPFTEADNHYDRGLMAGLPGNEYARGSYALNFGPNRGCFKLADGGSVVFAGTGTCEDGYYVDGNDLFSDVSSFWGDGVAGFNKSFDMGDFPGGTSNMVAIDEIRAGVHPLDVRGSWALGFLAASGTCRHGLFSMNEDGSGPNNADPDSDDIFGCSALHDAVGTDWLNSVGMPCFQSSQLDNEINFQATARSMHPGGVHVGMLDGSAHFLSDNINVDIWHKMHLRGNEEPINIPY